MTQLTEALIHAYENQDKWDEITSWDHESLFENFPYEYHENFNNKQQDLKQYSFYEWTCTDTAVGIHMLFLGSRFVGVSFRPYRKSETKYHWYSHSRKQDTYDYIMSFANVEVEESETYLTDEIFKDIVADADSIAKY